MLYVSTVYRDFEPAIEYRPLRYLTSFSLIWSKTGSDESWETVNLYFVLKIIDKISAQPHTTLCIQFLNKENNDKNNTFPLGKQIDFTIVWGCVETLP